MRKKPKTMQEDKAFKPAQKEALKREGLDPAEWIKVHENINDFTVVRKGTSGKKAGERRELRW